MGQGLSTGTVATENGSRYLQQLCKHWSHKFDVTFDAEKGAIIMPASQITLVAGPRELRVDLQVDEAGNLPRMKRVVAEHLDRFAFREAPLAFNWSE